MEDARGEIFCTVILRIEPRPYPLGPRRCERHALTRASPGQRNSSLRRGTIFWLYEEAVLGASSALDSCRRDNVPRHSAFRPVTLSHRGGLHVAAVEEE